MRVIIDTNVFLSYMLATAPQGAVGVVVTTCLTLDEIELLIPPDQLTEFAAKAATKHYFRSRVPQSAIDHFLAQLKLLGEMLPPLEEITSYTRDPKDDYLVTYGIMNEAEYLVTGDHDLRVLTRVGEIQIVSPSQFIKILHNHHLLP